MVSLGHNELSTNGLEYRFAYQAPLLPRAINWTNILGCKPPLNLGHAWAITSHRKKCDYISIPHFYLGWGLLSRFPPFRYCPNFSASPKHTLPLAYHVYICQVSPQLCCGDTCQIWMWFKEFNWCFYQIENFAYGEINERSFSNPHAWSLGDSRFINKVKECRECHRYDGVTTLEA